MATSPQTLPVEQARPDLDRQRAAGTLATVLAFPGRSWAPAPNPACVDWCEVEHAPDEFASGQTLRCSRTILDDSRFLVRAQSVLTPRADGTPNTDARKSGPYVVLHIAELTELDMLELLSAHCQAGEICGSPTAF